MADMNKVLCNVQQNLSDEQKRQARQNIGASDFVSLNLNDYEYDDLIDSLVWEGGFNRRGTVDEFVRYYPALDLLAISLVVVRSTQVDATSWVEFATLTDDRFYFSDFVDTATMPVGVFGIDSGSSFAPGVTYNPPVSGTNKNIVLSAFISSGKLAFKDVLIQVNNYGVAFNKAFIVCRKPSV